MIVRDQHDPFAVRLSGTRQQAQIYGTLQYANTFWWHESDNLRLRRFNLADNRRDIVLNIDI